jgi:hypothetical protein
MGLKHLLQKQAREPINSCLPFYRHACRRSMTLGMSTIEHQNTTSVASVGTRGQTDGLYSLPNSKARNPKAAEGALRAMRAILVLTPRISTCR